MKSFSYIAQDGKGKQVKGLINAENEQEFLKKVKDKGLFVKDYKESDSDNAKSIYKFNTKELSFCCRQLSAMLTSGLTLVKSIDILTKQQENEKARAIWQDIYENVQKGESFSQTLEMHSGSFPEFLISMVGAGESSGSLDVIMADELSNAEAMKNEFISSVSHELRTPLTAIKGWAETLMIDGGGSPETMKKGVGVIVNETERLSQMVEELLDFSRMQNGHFTLQMANMDILAELGDAVLIYSDKARRESKEIIYNEPEMLPIVFGDKNRIRQVFINVIDNAVKYSSAGDTVTIKAFEENGKIIVSVADTGVGIKESDLAKVKTKFYKANHTRRGSGIGLAVADEIVTMHGGSMDIASEGEGLGTTVTITLPTVDSTKTQ